MGSGPRTLLCQIHGRKTKGFVDDGLDVHMWYSEKDNYKCKNKSIVQSVTEGGPIARMNCDRAL